jgi:hypothetical protein
MPDVCRANGFSETLKIGHLAAAHQLQVSPHVVHELSIHVAGALSNGFLVEFMDWMPPDLFVDVPRPDPADGLVRIPDRPGQLARIVAGRNPRHRPLYDRERPLPKEMRASVRAKWITDAVATLPRRSSGPAAITFGILFKPILDEFGGDRSTLALAATSLRERCEPAGPRRAGGSVRPRRVILAALALMTIATALVSRGRALAVHRPLRCRDRHRLHRLRILPVSVT